MRQLDVFTARIEGESLVGQIVGACPGDPRAILREGRVKQVYMFVGEADAGAQVLERFAIDSPAVHRKASTAAGINRRS